MALRSQIGSSLVAKANPASPIRKTEELKVNNPDLPGKAEPGSLGRQFIEQPFLKPIPEGSARTVSVTPNAEAGSIASPTVNTPPPDTAGGIVPGVGSPNGSPQLRSGANNQAMFQGGISTPSPATAAAPVARAGVSAKGASVAGADKGAINPSGLTTDIGGTSVPVNYSAQSNNDLGLLPSISNWLGGKVSAADNAAKATVNQGRTTAQKIAGAIGSAINTIKPTGNLSFGLANKAQSWGGQPVNTVQGNKVVSKNINPVQAVTTALRSVVQNITSKLRSLFK
jgi:hypothetical protein